MSVNNNAVVEFQIYSIQSIVLRADAISAVPHRYSMGVSSEIDRAYCSTFRNSDQRLREIGVSHPHHHIVTSSAADSARAVGLEPT